MLTSRPPNATPQDLTHENTLLGQWNIQHPEARSSYNPRFSIIALHHIGMRLTGLRDDDILGLEELANTGPEPILCDSLFTLLWHNNIVRGYTDLQRRRPVSGQYLAQLREEVSHPDAWERGILHFGVVRVKLCNIGVSISLGHSE